MNDDKALAYHEAGHAGACIVLGLEFLDVTIIKSGNFLGLMNTVQEYTDLRNKCIVEGKPMSDIDEGKFINYVKVFYAGPMAEGKYSGIENWREHRMDELDFRSAGEIIEKMVKNNNPYLHNHYEIIDTERTKILNATHDLVENYGWDTISKIAEALYTEKKIDLSAV